jgi:hypothetical protein
MVGTSIWDIRDLYAPTLAHKGPREVFHVHFEEVRENRHRQTLLQSS